MILDSHELYRSMRIPENIPLTDLVQDHRHTKSTHIEGHRRYETSNPEQKTFNANPPQTIKAGTPDALYIYIYICCRNLSCKILPTI